MKFEIKKELLLEGFTKVVKVLGGKTSQPILNGILLEVEEDQLIFTGSDATETMRHCIPVIDQSIVVVQPGRIVFPREIVDITKKLNKKLTFSTNDFVVQIDSGKSHFELNCLDAAEYPTFPALSLTTPSVVLKGTEFSDCIKKTTFNASDSPSRPILQGVNVQLKKDCTELVCTDSHRLGRVLIPHENEHELSIVVPAKLLDKSSKAFDLELDIEIFVHEQNLMIKNGQTVYLTRLLDGKYPDTSRLIPTTSKSKMVVSRKELLDGLELVKEIANSADGNANGTIKIEVKNEVSISSFQAQRGKGKVDVAYDSIEGDGEFTLSCSARYVIDALKAMETEYITFHFNGSASPFLLYPADEGKIKELQLVLPVRTA